MACGAIVPLFPEQIEFGSTWPIVAAVGSSAGGAFQRASGRTPVFRRVMDCVYKADSMELQSLWKLGSDSEMAPQAIEISQNGLGDPWLAVCWEGESIRRIPYYGLL